MGQGEVPLAFEEWEDGHVAIALEGIAEDSPLKAGPKRSPMLNSLQFLLNKLLKREELPFGKVFLGVNGFPKRPSPAVSAREAWVGPPKVVHAPALHNGKASVENMPQLSQLASTLAEKSVCCGRTYAVLFLNKAQQACMLQAASGVEGLRLRTEGEAHWRRLVFEPNKPSPMPQKIRIALDKEGLFNKSPRVLAIRG